jgi:SAM-dependent methyltransferase
LLCGGLAARGVKVRGQGVTRTTEIDIQAAYHQQLFAAMYQWDALWQEALELVGNEEDALRLGLDQLGHFGPRGVALVAERLVASADGPLTRVLELGSGFGGALRQVGRILSTRGIQASLIGVELVADHCALSAAIGQATGDSDAVVLNADARCLPFSASSIDAIFAAGSASHFSSMIEVLAECRRVLRPGGVLAMTEEVSLRPPGAVELGEAFIRHHPPEVFSGGSPDQRRAELEAAGLTVEAFEPLVDWAAPLLRQRVQMLRLLGDCAVRMFGADAHQEMIGTLSSAADEFERGSILPVLIVARRPHQ